MSPTPLPMSPSLALLDFEQSPSDKLMFDLTLRHRSVSGSSLEVHHSSPVTVPGSARRATPYNAFPLVTDLPAGTLPDTPGPILRAFNRDPANHVTWRDASPTPFERRAPSTPVLTPLPGTNLSVEDIDPELVPLPPSVNPSTVHVGQSAPGYFDIPVDEHPQMDDADGLNGLACLKLASGDYHSTSVHYCNADAPVGHRGTAEEMRHQDEDAELQSTLKDIEIPRDQIRAHRRQKQGSGLLENARALGVPKHHQVLPLRLKQHVGSLRYHFRAESWNSEDWETCSGECSTAMASDHSLRGCDPNGICTSSPSSLYSAAPHSEIENGAGHDNDAPPESAHIIWNKSSGRPGTPASKSYWGGNISLYDGTGYGEDSGPSIPREVNEGIQDLETSSALLSVNGVRSGKETSTQRSRGEDPYQETVRQSSFTAHGHGDSESLESIYRAYTYPVGDRIPSSSSNSADEDVQRLAKKEYDISS